jgi:multiple sugar transport system substrate-binding protein
MTKRLSFLLALVLVCTMSGLAMAKATITHFHYSGHGQAWYDYLQERAAIFNASHPDIEVEVMISSSTAEYTQKFTVMLAGGSPPDVTDFHPALGAPYIVDGTFEDLTPYLKRDGIDLLRATSPAVMSVLSNNHGGVWGVPADIFPVVTFYNEEMFDKAGLRYPKDLGDLWNWDQVISSARKLTVDSNGDGNPEQWGVDRMWARWYMWVHQTGAQLYDRVIDPTKSNWNDPRVVQGFQFPLTLMSEGLGPKSNTSGVAQTYFWFGRTAISMVDGPGSIGAYLKDRDIPYNIAQQVRGPVNAGTEITVDAYEMISTSKNKDAAWEWMKFISLDVDSHARFVEMTGRAPSLTQLQRRYQQLCPYLPTNYMAFFEATAAAGTQTNYIIRQATAVNAVINPLITQIFTGSIPIQTAAAQIHEQVSAILATQ